ncbi:response regulator transcription factor [Herbiconiux sp. UC225_62]|uniref:response regulator transcription factor n=1 Tax=Herbiconiux sp. UC225_62 TaxID=3350168 RepID=UPI0036D3D896
MIRVALVDDHPLVRAGLVALLRELDDVAVVGEASDGAFALALVEDARPDLLLMDLSMPGTDGVTATTMVHAAHPHLPVLILTSSRDSRQLRDALAAGAAGYLLKDAEPAEIAAGIRAAARGEAPIDPRVARMLFPTSGRAAAPLEAQSDPESHPEPLVRGREAEVLRLVARGLANKQIARELGIAERTVKVHLGSVFRRLGVNDRTSAALWARENGY